MACVSGSTRVSSELGILPIEARSNVGKVSESGEVLEWIPQGLRSTVEVSTRCGRVLQCTPDQLLQTDDGKWKEAGTIVAGERLRLTSPRFSEKYYSVEWSDPPAEHHSVLINEAMGKMLGYFMGDGCLMATGINVACDRKDQDIVGDAMRALYAVIGTECIARDRGEMTLVFSHNMKWLPFLRRLGAVNQWKNNKSGWKRNVCVPDCIWRSPRSVVREFISALFECDAHAYRDTPRIAFFSKWEQFCRDVQLLLLGFGINSDIRTAEKKGGNGKTYTGRFLYITNDGAKSFYDKIGFISDRKRSSACNRLPRRKTIYRSDSDIVESVREIGPQQVYDLSVAESHRFSGNGFTVHNCTAEEGFQVHGIQVFPDDVMNYLQKSVNWRGKHGFFDENLQFHCVVRQRGPNNEEIVSCPTCTQDHSDEDFPLFVWELPMQGKRYVAGVDIAEGGTEGDYSVVHMVRIGHGLEPDTQVLEWRGQVDAVEMSRIVYLLGKAYNDAMVAMEVGTASGGGELCQWELTGKLGYQNIFRWKNYDSKNPLTNKFGWVTNARTRPMLITNGIRWLRQKIWKPQSPVFLDEARTFVRDDEEAKAKAASGTYDDVVMASLLCIFCAHESDFDPNTGRIIMPTNRLRGVDGTGLNWTCSCECGNSWDVADPRGEICLKCGRPVLTAKRKAGTVTMKTVVDFKETKEEDKEETLSYECL